MRHVRRIHVKVFHPGNEKFVRKTFVAGERRAFGEEQVDTAIDFIAEKVEKLFPGHDYEIVQVARDQFNFVWRSEKIKTAVEAAA